MAIPETVQARFVVVQLSKGRVAIVDNSDGLCDTIIIHSSAVYNDCCWRYYLISCIAYTRSSIRQ